MIRDGVMHLFGSPAEPLLGDEVRCQPERPYLPAAGVRTIFHADWQLGADGDVVCLACGTGTRTERTEGGLSDGPA